MQKLLEKERLGQKESQAFLAKLIGVDIRTYQNKEKGITQFKCEEMFIIARHYNKRIDEIFIPQNFEKREINNLKNNSKVS